MKQLPSLKQLEYLVSLAETLHFGQASEKCHITPSTLSAGIRDLEKVLGVSLAERSKRHVLMTSVGERIAARARLILRDAEDLMELAAADRKPMAGEMRLGVIPTISPFMLPGVLPGLRKQYPDLRLYLREEQTASLLAKLHAGEIDTALIALPFAIEGLASKVLFEDHFLFACNIRHPMASLKTVPVSELANQSLLLLEEGHCLRGHALEACHLDHRQERAQFEASSLHTLVQMVAAGMGVTLLPQLAIDAHITQGTAIKLIPLATPASRHIGLVWRQSSMRVEEFEMLGEVFRPALSRKSSG